MPGLGVLGGTFDPIHEAHLAIARAAVRELDLERVVLVPAARSPHKPEQPVATARARSEMIELAIAAEPQLLQDRRELDAGRPVYTHSTLEELAAEWRAPLWLLLGEDSFRALDRWARPERIAQLASIAVAARGSVGPDRRSGWRGARVHWLDLAPSAISATRIREQLLRGEPAIGLAPAVEAYIRRGRLYGATAVEP
jgi:nicotinate-nucleotide adenylyltransferase